MRTICPSCETSYSIPDDRIGPKGRKVRCTRCGEEWRVRAVAEAVEVEVPVRLAATGTHGGAGWSAADELFAPLDESSRPHPSDSSSTLEEMSEPDPSDMEDGLAGDATIGFDVPGPTAGAVAAPPARPPASDAEMAAWEDDAAEDGATAETDVESDAGAPEADAPVPTVAPAHRKSRGPILRRRNVFTRLIDLSPQVGLAIFVAACLMVAGLGFFRSTVVARVPTLGSFYRAIGLGVNNRGVVIDRLDTLRETEDGKPVLVVEGTVTNTTTSSRPVPALRLSLRDADAQELYVWSADPRADTIAAGESVKFVTRLVSPSERAAELQVRFIERRNRQAGTP